GHHRRPSEDHAGLRGVQEPQLHHAEEPAERPRPPHDQEVLPALRHAPRPPRDPL
ncbi:MAG: LSU ribosomal protein L33p @ LSU ribosomal protein L33p, zinc-dependent, partial [uncultured Actinomycetospora sp.]